MLPPVQIVIRSDTNELEEAVEVFQFVLDWSTSNSPPVDRRESITGFGSESRAILDDMSFIQDHTIPVQAEETLGSFDRFYSLLFVFALGRGSTFRREVVGESLVRSDDNIELREERRL
jgi:hypothetical protein